jgi:3-dehydroquinate dehydratase II
MGKSNRHNILVIHGPNLNMLGKREPEVYGNNTLENIDNEIASKGSELGLAVESFQSNHEGAIVEKLQNAMGKISGLIINPAAFTHTSVAIRDAVLLLNIPIIEVHLSNIYKRESFRHKSMLADVATGQIAGLGEIGYILALEAISSMVQKK